ncbi:MAG: S1 RNA-binding domain-containing protein [Myxococcota bacterium]
MSEQTPKKGPMVVVKRAGGAVETRVEPKPAVKPAAAAGAQAQPGESPAAETNAAVVRPMPVGPSVSDEVHESQSFAELFDAQLKEGGGPSRKLPRVGEKVKAKIFQLGAETVFATIGRHEAMIDLDELKDDEGILRFGVGDEIEAHVVETGAKGIVLSRKLSKGAASMSLLAEARQSGLPVEGLVIGVNKGGLEVAVGEARAFCPMSQVDVRPAGKLDELVGQRLTFRVTEVKDRKVVLSRRAILEEENRAKAAELKKTLSVGKVLKGTIVNVQAFGAFVDLGGLEGLIPVSEMSHVRVGHPSEVVKVGDEVEVEIIRLEEAEPNSPDKAKRKDRITLSMRRLMEDPFTKALETIKEGAVLKGKVVRLQPFGAFVELQPAVDGLIHISAMSERRIAHPRDVLKVGDEVEVKVEKIDPSEKRIGLRLVKDGVPVGEGVSSSGSHAPVEESAPSGEPRKQAPKPRRGSIVVGKVNRVEPFGIFIEWDGLNGLIPASETGTERGTDLKRVFPMGKEVKAEIIEIDGHKLKLSIVAAQRSEERADLDAWKKDQAKQAKSAGGFNSLADKLKGIKLG